MAGEQESKTRKERKREKRKKEGHVEFALQILITSQKMPTRFGNNAII